MTRRSSRRVGRAHPSRAGLLRAGTGLAGVVLLSLLTASAASPSDEQAAHAIAGAPAGHARGAARPAGLAPGDVRDAARRDADVRRGRASLATLVGAVIGSAIAGVLDELAVDRLPLVWLNGFLLFGAFAAIGLAASVSFDRLTPALGITAGLVVVMYFLEVLGTFWPDAEVLQPYSLFHYYQPKAILEGDAPVDQLRPAGDRRGRRDRVVAVRVPAAGPGRAELTPSSGRTCPACRAK